MSWPKSNRTGAESNHIKLVEVKYLVLAKPLFKKIQKMTVLQKAQASQT